MTDSIKPVEATEFALVSLHVLIVVKFEVSFLKLEGMAVLREPLWFVYLVTPDVSANENEISRT